MSVGLHGGKTCECKCNEEKCQAKQKHAVLLDMKMQKRKLLWTGFTVSERALLLIVTQIPRLDGERSNNTRRRKKKTIWGATNQRKRETGDSKRSGAKQDDEHTGQRKAKRREDIRPSGTSSKIASERARYTTRDSMSGDPWLDVSNPPATIPAMLQVLQKNRRKENEKRNKLSERKQTWDNKKN